MKQASGLKLIAVLEASKGLLALLVAFAVHELSPPTLQHWAETIVRRLHLNPTNHFSTEIMSVTDAVTSAQINLLVIGAVLYGLVRFIEAYGLWRSYRWTEWFALLSGAIYVPFEIYHMVTDFDVIGVMILSVNLMIIAYMWRTIAHKPK